MTVPLLPDSHLALFINVYMMREMVYVNGVHQGRLNQAPWGWMHRDQVEKMGVYHRLY